MLAAGVAFFSLLALVPMLVALVSIYGLVADPSEIEANIDDALAAAPVEVRDLVSSQLGAIVESSHSGLRLGAIVGILIALWSASSGVRHLIDAVNQAYDQHETRGIVRLRGMAVVMTIGGILLLVAAVAGLVVLPAVLDHHGVAGVARVGLLVLRWPLFAALALAALAVIYRYAPDRDLGRWQLLSPGAVAATVVWVIASLAFSVYTANFGRYNETYGSLGAVVIVMLWLFITAYVVIAGAELNAELERQDTLDAIAAEGLTADGDACPEAETTL
jgi:membrane protein